MVPVSETILGSALPSVRVELPAASEPPETLNVSVWFVLDPPAASAVPGSVMVDALPEVIA
jgi:hypothetical protein